jgi:DnaK suppressor protein
VDAEKLNHFRDLLINQLRQHTEQIKTDQAAALEFHDDGVKDSVDLSVQDLNKEIALRLGERSSKVVADIDQALLRIKEGSYGICARCSQPIDERRLEAVPTRALRCAVPGDHRKRERRRRSAYSLIIFHLSFFHCSFVI